MQKRKIKSRRDDRRIGHMIPGFHAVHTALESETLPIEALWIARGKGTERARGILDIAERRGIPIQYKARSELDVALPEVAHQGIVALVGKFVYADLDGIVERALREPGRGLILAADHITDEGNLGALIRTAAFFGAHGLLLPKDRSARVSEKVLKRSSGACAYLPVAQVVNLGRALDHLNSNGFWIVGAAGEGPESIYTFDWNRDVALVLGREDRGLTRMIRERCQQVVRVPGEEQVESLNVSVAGGVILSEIRRQRLAGGTAS